jgi:biopolymer transport protein TolR
MTRLRFHQRPPARCQMNMTPMIDVTFLLIIFFMLVSNIVAEENPEMVLPVLREPQAAPIGDGERVVVNLEPQPYGRDRLRGGADHLAWPGQPLRIRVGVRSHSLDDLGLVVQTLSEARLANPNVEVLLRADSALHYHTVQPVLDAIAAAGVGQVQLVTYRYKEALGREVQ